MAGHDPRGDLAPRDVVAARMAEVIGRGSAGHVWLDATGLGRDLLENGFPTVTAACRKHGIDPVTEMIPVAPGAHYSCGGIRADLDGRTSLAGLYAAGEAASTGVQGANRLASNSVTEAIIAGRRAGAAVAEFLSDANGVVALGHTGPADSGLVAHTGGSSGLGAHADSEFRPDGPQGQNQDGPDVDTGVAAGRRDTLAQAMSRYAGVMRDGEGLSRLLEVIAAPGSLAPAAPGRLDLESVEAANLRAVSMLIAVGARRRTESRGCHRRRDAADPAAAPWHTLIRWDGHGLVVTKEEL
jgi:L-aspartate oxidase